MLLPSVIEYNLGVAEDKYARLARKVGVAQFGRSVSEAARDFLGFVVELNAYLRIPRTLGEAGLRKDMIHEIVVQALPSGSLAANPKVAGKEDLEAILLGHLS